MKFAVVVLLLCVAVLVTVEAQGKGGKGKKPSKLPKLGKGKRGHGFKPPKGAEEAGIEASINGTRVKVISAKKGMLLLVWKELDEDHCAKPAEPVTIAEDGDQQDQDKPKGCPSRPLMFRMHSLYEVSENKTRVETAGHSVSLKDKKFTCTDPGDDPADVDFPESGDEPKGIKIPCTLTLTEDPAATITFSIFLTTQGGNFTNGDEQIEIEEGEVKFNLAVENWNFANEANGLVFEVNAGSRGKSKKDSGRRPNPGEGKKKPQDFVLDDGAKITFSEKAKVGAKWEDLPNELEVVEEKDGNLFKVYLPKGSNIYYDPTGDSGSEDSEAGSSADGAPYLHMATLFVMLFVAISSQL
jgi:hypothetical protein